MAGFNITDFNSQLKNGIVSTANFIATIQPPPCLNGIYNEELKDLTFLCNAARHPSMGVTTERINKYGYAGASFLTPYSAIYEDMMAMDFYIRASDALPLKIFYYWIQQVVGMPNVDLHSPSAGRLLKPGQVAYRNTYTTEMSVITYNFNSNQLIKSTMYGVYPTRINEIQTSWNQEDIARIEVQFAFTGVVSQIGEVANSEDSVPSGKEDKVGDPNALSPAYAEKKLAKEAKHIEMTSKIDKLLGSDGGKDFYSSPISAQLNSLEVGGGGRFGGAGASGGW
jgi:uncharacterized membrane protein YgcG